MHTASIKSPVFQRWATAVLISGIAALLFSTNISLFGYSYKAGDIAVIDVMADHDITLEGTDIKKGEIVVRGGDRLTEDAVKKLKAVQDASYGKGFLISTVGVFLFSIILFYTAYTFSARNIRKFASSPKDILLMGVILITILTLIRLSLFIAKSIETAFPVIPFHLYLYLLPVAAGPMLVRLFLNSETALIFAAVISLISGVFLEGSLSLAAYFFIGGIAAAKAVRHATQRATITKAGLILGCINMLVIASFIILKGNWSLREGVITILFGFIGGQITSVIVTGVAPVFEIVFGYTTNIRHLELARMDHPLLKELALHAPGTYHHSIIIGSMVEAAAEEVNANPLLSKVSAYYHDIGKVKTPLYFIENMRGENKHDSLAPEVSARILISHVTEGVELANEHRLGEEITEIIRQHHGTSLISYFYQKAKAKEGINTYEVDEKDFRYPGPKPRSKEAGLVMLADVVEAASKTIPDPTPANIQAMVQRIINRVFMDGQLDECELTVKDISAIERSFKRALTGMFHQRIEYPEKADFIYQGEAIEDIDKKRAKGEGWDKGDKEAGKGGIKRFGLP
ncbi:MAG TPA: HDIG domain-containing protein [Thermodesulfobacteriota bacterium]|nr:HDIG domain-containing protein [Thermodesulfobacteriota bacterium]